MILRVTEVLPSELDVVMYQVVRSLGALSGFGASSLVLRPPWRGSELWS